MICVEEFFYRLLFLLPGSVTGLFPKGIVQEASLSRESHNVLYSSLCGPSMFSGRDYTHACNKKGYFCGSVTFRTNGMWITELTVKHS